MHNLLEKKCTILEALCLNGNFHFFFLFFFLMQKKRSTKRDGLAKPRGQAAKEVSVNNNNNYNNNNNNNNL